jgi:ankyrin repeat protein
MSVRFARPIVALSLLAALAAPATAQIGGSESSKFLQAIKDQKGDDVIEMLNKPGTTIINTRDYSTRETALHIVARRGDERYTLFLLQKGADPNIRDGKGNTPLMIAVSAGADPVVQALIKHKANVNLANDSGETPLIRAVQQRDINLVRELLTAGADPDAADSLAGMSARDYAHSDSRAPAIAKLIDETPKRDRKAVAGPKL